MKLTAIIAATVLRVYLCYGEMNHAHMSNKEEEASLTVTQRLHKLNKMSHGLRGGSDTIEDIIGRCKNIFAEIQHTLESNKDTMQSLELVLNGNFSALPELSSILDDISSISEMMPHQESMPNLPVPNLPSLETFPIENAEDQLLSLKVMNPFLDEVHRDIERQTDKLSETVGNVRDIFSSLAKNQGDHRRLKNNDQSDTFTSEDHQDNADTTFWNDQYIGTYHQSIKDAMKSARSNLELKRNKGVNVFSVMTKNPDRCASGQPSQWNPSCVSCARDNEQCNCDKLFECVRKLSDHDFIIFYIKNFLETDQGDSNFGKLREGFNSSTVKLFPTYVEGGGIDTHIANIRSRVEGSEPNKCRNVLAQFTRSSNSRSALTSIPFEGVQHYTQEICDAVGSPEKITFETMSEIFGSEIALAQGENFVDTMNALYKNKTDDTHPESSPFEIAGMVPTKYIFDQNTQYGILTHVGYERKEIIGDFMKVADNERLTQSASCRLLRSIFGEYSAKQSCMEDDECTNISCDTTPNFCDTFSCDNPMDPSPRISVRNSYILAKGEITTPYLIQAFDESMQLVLGKSVSLGSLQSITNTVKEYGPSRMPFTCCLDDLSIDKGYLGRRYIGQNCTHYGPFHTGLSIQACRNALGVPIRTPCVTLKECIDNRPKKPFAEYNSQDGNGKKSTCPIVGSNSVVLSGQKTLEECKELCRNSECNVINYGTLNSAEATLRLEQKADCETLRCENIENLMLTPDETKDWTIYRHYRDESEGYSESFEEYALTIVIKDASDESQCERVREELGFARDYPDDKFICEQFSDEACDAKYCLLDGTIEDGRIIPEFERIEWEGTEFDGDVALTFKNITGFKIEGLKEGVSETKKTALKALEKSIIYLQNTLGWEWTSIEATLTQLGAICNAIPFGHVSGLTNLCWGVVNTVFVVLWATHVLGHITLISMEQVYHELTPGGADALTSLEAVTNTNTNSNKFYSWASKGLITTNENIVNQHQEMLLHLQDAHTEMINGINVHADNNAKALESHITSEVRKACGTLSVLNENNVKTGKVSKLGKGRKLNERMDGVNHMVEKSIAEMKILMEDIKEEMREMKEEMKVMKDFFFRMAMPTKR